MLHDAMLRHSHHPSRIILAALLSSALIGGCGSNAAYNVPPAKLHIGGKNVSVPYVAIVNDREVSLDEYRYFFLSAKYAADGGDDSYWENDADGSRQRQLKNDALHALLETCAVQELAQEADLSLTKEEQAQIDSDVENQVSLLGGAEEYAEALSDNYMTDELYRFLWQTNFYCEKLWNHYFSSSGAYYVSNTDAKLSSDDMEEFYQIKFKAIIAETVDNLDVQLSDDYDLITVESLQ